MSIIERFIYLKKIESCVTDFKSCFEMHHIHLNTSSTVHEPNVQSLKKRRSTTVIGVPIGFFL